VRAFGSVDSVEEARGSVKCGGLQGSLDAFGSGGLLGGGRGHVQARALSLQLGLARADCVLGSFSKSGLTRGDAVSDALVQAVHVIGGCCEACMGVVCGVVCVLYVFGVCVLHVMWIVWYRLLQLYALKPAQVQGGPDDIH
jgi:hypothetical protein